jgi:Tfp pilus assembly protein PilN
MLVLTAALMQAACLRLESRIGRLRGEIAPIEDTANAVARKRQQLLALDAHLAQGPLPLIVLTELYRVTPEGVNIVQLRMRGDEVDITGQADPAERAYTYLSDLMESRVLTDVHFHGAHPVRRGAGAVTEFSYTCQAAVPQAASKGENDATH